MAEETGSISQKLRKTLGRILMNKLVAAIASIVFGVILLIWTGSALDVIVRIFGIILILSGLFSVIMFLVRRDGLPLSTASFVGGVVLAVLGASIYFNPAWLVSIFPIVMGIVIVLSGVSDLGETITLGQNGIGKWWVSLLISIVIIGLGLLILFNPMKFADAIVKVIGIVLIINGISDLYVIIKVRGIEKEVKQDIEAVETEGTVVDEAGQDSDKA